MRAKAILVSGVRQVEAGDAEIPDPGPGEVLIEAAYTCISPGTELRCLDGKHPEPYTYPYITGYSTSGTVLKTGEGATLAVGTPVFCSGTARSDRARLWGGHVSHAVQPQTSVFPLPDGVSLLEATTAKLAAIAYHGVRLSRPMPHETVAVIGLGPIGQLSARLHAVCGARVIGIDPVESRVRLLQSAGVEAARLQGSLSETWSRLSAPKPDIVVDATGHPGVIPDAIDLAAEKPWDDSLARGARYMIQGSYPASIEIPYHPPFLKEIAFLLPRDHQARDVRAVLDLMKRGKLRPRDLISEVRSPEDAPAIYARLREDKGSLMTVAFRWNDAPAEA